jgi:hypothetical protein
MQIVVTLFVGPVFPSHCLIDGTIFEKKVLNIKCVFLFSLQLLANTFLILKRIQRDIVINVKTSSCKVPVIPVGFERKLNFRDRFQISNFIKKFVQLEPSYFMRTDRLADRQKDGRTDGQKKT